MNISKDGRTLYFSDEEIDHDTNGEKKVYVTKRINGRESHVKAQKNTAKHLQSKNNVRHLKQEKEEEDTFNFNNEIVIGVNVKEENEEKNKKRNNKNRKKINKKQSRNQQTNNQKNQSQFQDKKEKNKKFKKKILAIFSGILLIAIVIIFALTAPIFNITDIQIQGNEKVSSDTILSLSGLKKGENIFKFNNSIIQSIKENTYIESVQITRKLPGTVIISVEEREVKYQINLINSYAYIDKNGYILENSTVKKDVPVLVGLSVTEDQMLNKERLKTEDLEKLNKIAKIMEAAKTIEINNLITEINTENENDYVLYLESKNKTIHIGDTSNLTNKMLYVQKILENEEGKSGIAFVNGDISAGFKPYFREE